MTRSSNRAWLHRWKEAEAATRAVVEDPPATGLLEGQILASVVGSLPRGSNLLVASSMPIRDLDAFVPTGPDGLRVYGNRGVSGIDGLVSTTLGLALGADGAGPTVGVLGDLALFHDLNGLQSVSASKLPVVFVVVNNDGGGIFQMLPVRNHEPAFTEFFSTPHGMDFQHAAALHGLAFHRVGDLPGLERELSAALASGSSALLEIRTDREETHEGRRAVLDAVASAMDRVWNGPKARTKDL